VAGTIDDNVIVVFTATIEQWPGHAAAAVKGLGGGSVFTAVVPFAPLGTPTLHLQGLTVTGGSTEAEGGGIENSGTLTITDCTITGNAAESGGGIENFGTLTITDSTVSHNETGTEVVGPGGEGGGIENSGTLTITASTISNNSETSLPPAPYVFGSSPNAVGGGIYDRGTATITDSTISNNTANATASDGKAEGGGIYDGGTATITDSTIGNNTANATASDGKAEGGGIYDGGTATITDSTISNNTANASSGATGGGVMNEGGSQSISNSTISGNTAAGPNGGGGGVSDWSGGFIITDSTISGNSATAHSAAIQNRAGLLQMAGDIVADAGGHPAVSECQFPITDMGYNVDDDGTCGLSGASHSVSDSATIGTYLGPLQDNGGPTETIALSSGATNPAQAVIPVTFTPPAGFTPACHMQDQRGVSRAAPCDMGAFALTMGAPEAPTNLVAALGVGQASLSWNAPSSGVPLVSYTVSGNDTTTSTAITPVTVTGTPPATSTLITELIPGDAYTFTVTSTNAAGPEVASTPLAVLLPAPFFPDAPSRICDSRPGNSTLCSGKTLGPGGILVVQVSGHGGVPAGATAVVANITATAATQTGFLTAYPDGSTKPNASNLNFTAGETVPNLVTVPLSSTGAIDLFNALGNVDVIVDVSGYYGPGSGQGFTSLTPSRICDTRSGNSTQCTGETMGPASTLTIQVTGHGGVPSGAAAVVANVTATGPTTAGFLTAYAADETRPNASNLNFTAGETVPNRVIIPLSSTGQLELYNALGNVDAIVDVNGYFSSATSGYFEPVAPARICDTRHGNTTPCAGQTLSTRGTLNVQVTGNGGIPSGATAVVANVTVTGPTATGFLTVWPTGQPKPNASDLNFTAGETVSDLVAVPLSSSGAIDLFNAIGSADVIVDVSGWFTS
jgi:hypothetical protein